jgi:uncharacterized membrane protein
MAEDTERDESGGEGGATDAATETATEAAGQGQSAVGGAAERVKGALGDGVPNKVLVPAALAAAVAAGYAATKGAPKLKGSVKSKATSKAEDAAQGALSEAEQTGGVTGLAAKVVKGGAGGDGGGGIGGMVSGVASKVTGGGGKDPSQGWGKGRRNPIQRWADVAVPIETAYNQWTQFEEFPKFMHRVLNVQQDEEDRAKVKWQEKIWLSKRDWEAQITEQIPDTKIAWKTVSGTSHVGHVTFHRLDENLTRVLVTIDFNPSGLFEKMASGFRFAKRAAESDLCRFKAFIEAHGEATGAWRGRIEDGEVVDDPGVEEGKPLEEGQELRTPEGRAAGEKKEDDEAEDESSEEDEGPQGESGDEAAPGGGEEDEEADAERREREQRREERRAATASAS